MIRRIGRTPSLAWVLIYQYSVQVLGIMATGLVSFFQDLWEPMAGLNACQLRCSGFLPCTGQVLGLNLRQLCHRGIEAILQKTTLLIGLHPNHTPVFSALARMG